MSTVTVIIDFTACAESLWRHRPTVHHITRCHLPAEFHPDRKRRKLSFLKRASSVSRRRRRTKVNIKVKGPDKTAAYMETRKAAVYRLIRSGVLTSINSRQHSANSGRPLPEVRDGLWTHQQSADRQIHLCPSQPHYGLHPAIHNLIRQMTARIMSSSNDSLFFVTNRPISS